MKAVNSLTYHDSCYKKLPTHLPWQLLQKTANSLPWQLLQKTANSLSLQLLQKVSTQFLDSCCKKVLTHRLLTCLTMLLLSFDEWSQSWQWNTRSILDTKLLAFCPFTKTRKKQFYLFSLKSIHMDFSQHKLRLNSNILMSFYMQQVNLGHGLLRGAFWDERGCWKGVSENDEKFWKIVSVHSDIKQWWLGCMGHMTSIQMVQKQDGIPNRCHFVFKPFKNWTINLWTIQNPD